MKKKSRFLINIALLALSLCIMVYGVYSAKQATLNVFGTIGFTAHNLSVKIGAVTIEHAIDANGAAVATSLSGYSDSSKKELADINVGALYFDDLTKSTATADNVSDIVIKVNLFNYSQFKVGAATTQTTFTQLKNTSNTDIANVTYKVESTGVMTASSNGTAEGGNCTITITLHLGSTTSNLSLNSFKVPVTLSKVA